IRRRFDRFAASGFGRGDDTGGEGMPRAFRRKGDDFRQPAAVARLGYDPQAFGKEQAFLTPRLLVAQGTKALYGRIGECRDLSGHGYSSPNRSSTSSIS